MIVVVIWSLNWTIMKSALSLVDPLSLVLAILALSAAALSPILVFAGKDIHGDKKTIIRLLLVGVINGLMMTTTLVGLVHEKSGIGAVLNYTQPLFVFFLSIPFLKGEASVSRLTGALIGFLGVAVLSVNRTVFAENYAYFLLVLGAFLWATMILFYKKWLSNVNPVLTCFAQQGVGALFMSVITLTSGPARFSFPLEFAYISMILYSSILAYGIAAVVWIHLVAQEEVTVLSSSSYLVPAIAVFLGWILLGENPELRSILGMILILSGVYVVNRPSHR